MDRRICALRVLACFMVVLLHVSAETFVKAGPGWWAGNVFDSLARSCVPLFFMIAGATMLRRDEEIGPFFRKRVLRILPPLVFWSLFYLWWLWFNGGGPANWALAMVQGPTMYHLWYFYALVGIYAAMPILRKFYLHSSRRDRLLMLGGWFFVASLIPTAHELLFNRHCEGSIRFDRLNDVFHLTWFGGYIGFVLMGALIADKPAPARYGWAAFLGGSLATMAGNWWLATAFGQPCEFFMVYFSPFVVAAGWGIFTIVMSSMREGAAPRWLAILSNCTLGIYGIHVIVIGPVMARLFGWGPLSGNAWLNPLPFTIVSFAVCFLVIGTLRLVPPLRRVF
jgi:surface polysaccharide O-acyltransferase-like enzyme